MDTADEQNNAPSQPLKLPWKRVKDEIIDDHGHVVLSIREDVVATSALLDFIVLAANNFSHLKLALQVSRNNLEIASEDANSAIIHKFFKDAITTCDVYLTQALA